MADIFHCQRCGISLQPLFDRLAAADLAEIEAKERTTVRATAYAIRRLVASGRTIPEILTQIDRRFELPVAAEAAERTSNDHT